MDKNKKILYCLIGCFFLVMLKSSFYSNAESILYLGRGYGATSYGVMINAIISFFSAVGYILTVFFSVLLIILNINFKK